MGVNQVEMVMLDSLVRKDHPYRKLKSLLDFDKIQSSVKVKESELGTNGYGKRRLVMCLILQFIKDLSDREFERFLAENNAGKWFTDFGLTEKTPDYTTICKFRNAIGCKQVSDIFAEVKRQMQKKN